MLTERYEQALIFVNNLHSKQLRKGTTIPYMSHLMGVSSIVLEDGGDEDEAIGALLHDTIEDCSDEYPGGAVALRRDIRKQFGNTVLEIVEHCTDADTKPKPPWHSRKQSYIDSIANKPDNALRVSCSDKLHNARAILRDYREHGEELWGRFKGGRDSLWYYSSLVSAFKETGRVSDSLLGELDRTVRELHGLASEKYSN